MNYVQLLNSFWVLNSEYSLTPNEKALYFALLNKCNSLGWKNPFNQSNEYLALESGLSLTAFIKARNTLKQVGLIDFTSGNGRRNNTVYTLKGCHKGYFKNILSDTLSDTLSSNLSDTLSEAKQIHNTKHKQNKTKLNNKPLPLSGQEEEVLQLPFDSSEFKETWNQWKKHRKEIKHALTPTQEQNQLKQMKSWGERESIERMNQSILNGWQGLFEVKNTGEKSNGNGKISTFNSEGVVPKIVKF